MIARRRRTVLALSSTIWILINHTFVCVVKHHGSLTLDQVIDIARKNRTKSLARELKGTVLEVLGTCSSMGCNVEGMSARDMTVKVKSGEVAIPAK